MKAWKKRARRKMRAAALRHANTCTISWNGVHIGTLTLRRPIGITIPSAPSGCPEPGTYGPSPCSNCFDAIQFHIAAVDHCTPALNEAVDALAEFMLSHASELFGARPPDHYFPNEN